MQAVQLQTRAAFCQRAVDLIELTKPRIIALLLVTTYATMLIAAGENPSLGLIFLTLLGGALTAGSANAINMVYDRDIDALMRRTSWRPIPSGRIKPGPALVFALALGIIGFVELWFWVNPPSALLALFGHLFYVFVYTIWLKRRSVQNIVIGGAAGAIPPLVGWAAVTGTINWAAFILFLIVFLWTPPHFWALALYKNDDYKAAGVPMMPVVRGKDHTLVQMLAYCAGLVPVSVALALFHPMTPFYVAAAAVLGGLFAWYTYRLARERTDAAAKRVFAYSIVYLGLLFGTMVFDRIVMAQVFAPVVAPRGVEGMRVDTLRRIAVHFEAGVEAGIPMTVAISQPSVTLHPNEMHKLVYRVTNQSDRPLTIMAEHDIAPEVAAGFFKKVECFCFREQALPARATVEMPLVFSFVDHLPREIESVRVRYDFRLLAQGVSTPSHTQHDH